MAQNELGRWQVEIAAGIGGARSLYMSRESSERFTLEQSDLTSWYMATSKIFPIKGKYALRAGLSLENHGIVTNINYMPGQADAWAIQTPNHWVYLGAPVVVSHSTMKPGKKLGFLFEAGLAPQLLLTDQEVIIGQNQLFMQHNHRRFALSNITLAALHYKLSDKTSILFGLQTRLALTSYDKKESTKIVYDTFENQYTNRFRPILSGVSVGMRF